MKSKKSFALIGLVMMGPPDYLNKCAMDTHAQQGIVLLSRYLRADFASGTQITTHARYKTGHLSCRAELASVH